MKRQNLIGKRVGQLEVIEKAYSKKGNVFWKCQCDCGNICYYSTGDLNRGQIKSCGCYKKSGVTSITHGLTHNRIRTIWVNMKQRCENPNNPNYKYYGDRGITVCKEWQNLETFYEWANSNGYRDNLTIDRIDVNGNYEPSNCRWITMKEQHNNKRSNRIIEYRGQKYTLTQLAEKSGIKKTTLKERLNLGWSVEDAVSRPVRQRTRGYRPSGCAMVKPQESEE